MKKLLTAIAFLPLLAACNKEEAVVTEPVATDPVVVAPAETTTVTPAATVPAATQETELAPAVDTAAEPATGSSGSSVAGAMQGSGGGMYVVEKGDTLWGIANKNGIAHGDLAEWNNIDDPRDLHVGRELRLSAP